MIFRFLKLTFIILLFLQVPLYPKSKTLNDFNSQYLSNYFSGIVAYDNKNNEQALKFFRSSKFLIKKHDPYLKKYVYTLVLENEVRIATNEIKQNLRENNSKFFEAYLILSLDSLKKKNFEISRNYLNKSYKYIDNDRIALIVYESLKEYLDASNFFLDDSQTKFGNLSFINEVFQRCYLQDENIDNYFKQLINSDNDMDYSRYTFFYIHHLVKNNKLIEAKQIADDINILGSSLLVSQGKSWIKDKKLDEFSKIFSCQESSDIAGEFFYLIANLYTSQNDHKNSNFYLNISQYLNPKFKFNLSLLAENYYTNNNYEKAGKILDHFNQKDDLFYWFKLKKQAQIISKKTNNEEGLKFINDNFKKINDPSLKMIFDIANFHKNVKKYKEAIIYYNRIISKIEVDSSFYAEILYRRGSAHERLGDHINSDKDLLRSLEINPEDAYILNYLAYSWLERDYKIDVAIDMLKKAYELRSNDPYIIDSIGWAYFLIDDFLKAEQFLKRAVELMPEDPTVNDHYGDILWMLNRKIQARYFWTSVLNLEDTEEEMKKNINLKLIEGLKAS